MISTGMSALRRLGLTLALLGAAACSHGTPSPAPTPSPSPGARGRTVIVLGFDGFARRYLDTDSAPASTRSHAKGCKRPTG
ncbi:MAG TPA: hypothetical protein VK511_06780 [Gemmatimonadaceae bacterium]|nr:hypothetical protein [Gemmatimonadaceae bacterium]